MTKNYLQVHHSLHILHVDVIDTELSVTVQVRLEGGRVYEAFVKDQPVTFGVGSLFKTFDGRIAYKEVGVDHTYFASVFVEWVGGFIKDILFHDVVIELLGARYIDSEASHFTALFSILGLVAIIFRTSRGEFTHSLWSCRPRNHLAGHDVGKPTIDDRVLVEAEDLLL